MEIIESLIEHFPGVGLFEFEGFCDSCKKEVKVKINLSAEEENRIRCEITGGAAIGFNLEKEGIFEKLRCQECQNKHGETETYARVVGYLSPVKRWHKGKRLEFEKRVMFDLDSI